VKRLKLFEAPRCHVLIVLRQHHRAQSCAGTKFEKDGRSSLHATLQASFPLHSLRYLSSELFEACLQIKDGKAIDTAQFTLTDANIPAS
jgi:hypothetical protein